MISCCAEWCFEVSCVRAQRFMISCCAEWCFEISCVRVQRSMIPVAQNGVLRFPVLEFIVS